jgi:hypothetical protein
LALRKFYDRREPGSSLWLGLYIAAAIGFTWDYWCGATIMGRAAFDSLTYFFAETPFQYRILIPLLARGIEWLHPVALDKLYLAITMVWMLALLPSFARYLRIFVPRSAAVPAALLITYPLFFNYVFLKNVLYYPWDMPSIVFFIWGLTLLLERRMAWYYPVFVLATLNRETTCFLILAMLCLEAGRQPVGRLALHLLAQSAIWLGIKLLLARCFAGNPGAGMHENHFHDNLHFIATLLGRPDTWHEFTWLRALGRLLVFGGIWALVPLGWKNTPPAARRLLWVVPPFFAAMMFVGVIHEVRIFGELIPILMVPALYGLGRCLRQLGVETAFSRGPDKLVQNLA